MSEKHDRQFMNLISIVIGGLVGLAVGIFALSSYIGRHAGSAHDDEAEYRRQVQADTAPFGHVAVAGQDNAALTIAGTAAAPAVPAVPVAPAAPAAVLAGGEVYKSTCSACHAAGIAGAPRYGDKAAWAARIGQGKAVLGEHALKGFTGKSGVMPAKGGRIDLADQSVLNAVDYMVAAAK